MTTKAQRDPAVQAVRQRAREFGKRVYFVQRRHFFHIGLWENIRYVREYEGPGVMVRVATDADIAAALAMGGLAPRGR